MATRAIIWISDTAASGEVFHRQQVVSHWPITVGRAIDNDIVLLDPHVAAHHLRLEHNDAALSAQVLETVNPVVINDSFGSSNKVIEPMQSAPWPSTGVLTIGRTSLRYIDETTALAPEKIYPASAPLAANTAANTVDTAVHTAVANTAAPTTRGLDWQSALGIFFLLMAVTTAEAFITNNPDTYLIAAFKAAGLALGAIAIWALLWAILSKVFSGRLHYFEHALLAAKFIIVTSVVLWHLDMLSFMFSIEWLGQFDGLITILAGAWLISKHLKIALNATASTISGRKVSRIVTAVTTVLGLSVAGLMMGQRYQNTGHFNEGLYLSTFMPPSWRLHKAQPPTVLVDGLAGIKAKADALAQSSDDKGTDEDSEE